MIPSAPHRAVLRAALAVLVSATALSAFAQANLKIPQGNAEFRELIKDLDDEPCTTCGVLVSLRTEAVKAGGRKAELNLAKNPSLRGGPGGELATVPLAGGTRAFRRAGGDSSAGIVHIVTVRYDNGSYARFEQRDEPRLKRGERVRVTNGRVEPYLR